MRAKTILVLLLGLLLGGILAWAALSGQIQSAYQLGYQTGYTAGQAAKVTPVALTISASSTVFNLSSNIASDGSATNGTASVTVTIKNLENTSATVVVTLKNPATGKEGLPDALENSYFNVYVGTLTTKYLFIDAEYTDGLTLPVDSHSVVSLTLTCEVEDAPAGTFADGQTYTMNVYFYQSSSDYADVLSFSVLT